MEVKIKEARQRDAETLEIVANMPLRALRNGDDRPEDHSIVIPVEALANRRALYGLATDEEAIAAILREHATRLNDAEERTPVSLIDRLGGLREDVTVSAIGELEAQRI